MRCILALLTIFALFPLIARADLLPPPPKKGLKRIPYENFMKLERAIPTYRFFTFAIYLSGVTDTSVEELVLDTVTAKPVPGDSRSYLQTGVVAVPELVFRELKTTKNLGKLISKTDTSKLPAGVVVCYPEDLICDIRKSDPRTKIENVITVIPDDKAGVRFSARRTPGPLNEDVEPEVPVTRPLDVMPRKETKLPRKEAASELPGESEALELSTRPMFSPIVAGTATFLAIFMLGFWVMRRK